MPGAQDAAVVRLHYDGDLFPGGHCGLHMQSLAGPGADNSDGTDDVGLNQGATAVFAAPDMGLMLPIISHQQHVSMAGPCADRDFHPVRGPYQVHRRRGLLGCLCASQGGVDSGAVRADDVPLPVHDHGRRVNVRADGQRDVSALAFGRARKGERILPPKIVPVGHVECQRQKVWSVTRQFRHNRISRRAGRTTLGSEQFHDQRASAGLRESENRHHASDTESKQERAHTEILQERQTHRCRGLPKCLRVSHVRGRTDCPLIAR